MELAQLTILDFPTAYDFALSLGSYEPIKSKEQADTAIQSNGRAAVEEHWEQLCNGGRVPPDCQFVVAVSCRNTLSNIRCGAWVKGKTNSFITVDGEDSANSSRPYFILGYASSRFSLTEMMPTQAHIEGFEWAVSGVPIYWDGENIFDRMLAEASDFSHIYHLPRGASHQTTESSVAKWRELRDIGHKHVISDRASIVAQLQPKTVGLTRERTYLHNCVGVTPEGSLICMMATGQLEEIGKKLADLGTTRAIVLDNGGSTSAFCFKVDDVASRVQLVGAPNFRAKGTAYIFGMSNCPGFTNSSVW